ncbi:MAG: gliding motility-associated C-terminal domain-containing protein [Bacteroidota bacterium]|nr:gliding motility-associated C-terminal domain-containing protein [Bacteroidota bacterium]
MIKKIALSILLCFITTSGFSQFISSGSGRSIQLTGSAVKNIDAVFLFNGITADNQIQFTGSASSYLWKKYDGSFVSNLSAISVEDGTGYVLTANGVQYYIWVIDYQKYLPSLNALAVSEGVDKCSNISLNLLGKIPDLVYYDKNSIKQLLSRQFTVSYPDQEYASGQWSATTRSLTETYPFSTIVLNAPYKDTNYTLSGDQYATLFGIASTVTSDIYKAIRVECHPTGSIIERDAANESGRKTGTLEGSGPLNVSFKSNANLPVTQFYEWRIYNLANTTNYLRYTDADLRYVFNETGDYKVTLTVTNSASSCSYSDSLTVKVSASFINVPNVFTPNGDGQNDQFRVSYRSIANYKILLYSSWAGRVYTSTDPAQGWDGRVGGRLAPPGVYYYLISATGTDGKKFKLKGNVNLLRGKNVK